MGLANKLAGAPPAGPPGAPPMGAYQAPSAPPMPGGAMPSTGMPPPGGAFGQPPSGQPAGAPFGMPPRPAPVHPTLPYGMPPGAGPMPPSPYAAAAPPYGAHPPAGHPGAPNPYGAPGAPPMGPTPGAPSPYGSAPFGVNPYGPPGGPPAPGGFPPGAPPAGAFPTSAPGPYGGPPQQMGMPPQQMVMPPQQMGVPPGVAPAGAGAYGPRPGAGPYPAAGMPPPGAAPGGAPGGMAGAILAKLTTIVNVNGLHRFYPPQALQALAARVDSRVNFNDLAARWRLPKELALDMASLALYDIVMFVDDSGSMAFEENGERIDDLKLIASKVSEVATLFDDDGILIRFMNSSLEGNGIRSPADVAALLAQIQYCGTTPLASSLAGKVLQPVVYHLASAGQLSKPVLIITITDGEPTDTPKDMVVQVIRDARQRLASYGPKTVAFEFAQVGKDARACQFLQRLDQDPVVGSSIDCTSYYELEQAEYARKGVQLSPEAWLVKMMCGAVDPSLDEQDE